MCRRTSAPPLDSHLQEPVIQIRKPSLTRKLVGSAKINLNEYWNVFEAIMEPSSVNAENENLDNERRLANLNLADQKSPTFINTGSPHHSNTR